jgi:LysM repeat protein
MYKKPIIYRIVTWSISVALIFSFLATALPEPVQASYPQANCKKTYTIKPGESIYRIARDHEISVYRLAKTNGLKRPFNLSSGQTLCIPAIPKPSSNFSWNATYTSNQIRITGTDFKKQHPFYVKVRENDLSNWYKLGSAQSNRYGEMTVKYNLPKDLLKKSILTVCLKDGITDYLSCQRVFRQ